MSRSRITLTSLITTALVVFLATDGSNAASPRVNGLGVAQRQLTIGPASIKTPDDPGLHRGLKPKQNDAGRQIYIVQLKDRPVATYTGGTGSYARTMVDRHPGRQAMNVTSRGLLDTRSQASRAYASYLGTKQAEFKQRLEQRVGHSVSQVYSYKFVLNGLALRLTESEASRAASLPGIKSIRRSNLAPVDTSDTPEFLGVDGIWDGSGTGLPAAMGEGLIFGDLDTGINLQNHSFATTGDDGYTVVNPLGDGVALGECNDFPGLCNNKLIGCYYFLEDSGGTDPLTPEGDPVCKDTDGHGSHTASTAAGNQNDQATVYNVLGGNSGYSFGRISGMAPHANIIAYKVCAPSCGSGDRIAATEQAIQDGVNVLNHSIGSGSQSPWEEDVAVAFLNARAAGIFVAVSAGNDGPAPGTAARGINAPWTTSSGASTHWREIPDKTLHDMSGGDTAPPDTMTGKGLTGGYTGPIVYAGDFDNGDPQPEQCFVEFPPGTWTNGEIVVCDRGTIARVLKCANVAAGGAAGCILANVDGGATDIDADPHVIPAIHIASADGNRLKAWLASGTGQRGTIAPTPDPVINPDVADIMASFSSRGPYTGLDLLVPSVSAPGVDVFAAGSNLQFHHPGFDTEDPNDDPSVPGDYGIISGTSMASPHTAGSAALLRQLHPDWTLAEIQSAFMTTGTTAMRKEDGATPADPFDFGGGRIQPALAAQVGLVLDETVDDYETADPALGGDPSTLNMASMVSNGCAPTCSWQRTVRNATDASVSYHVTTEAAPGMSVEVSPADFTLDVGATQTLSISADVIDATKNAFSFGQVLLNPDSGAAPVQHLTVAAFFATASDPDSFVKTVNVDTAPPGAKVTYKLNVSNTGEEDVFNVSDVVPANATFVAGSETEVVTGGETLSPWTYSGGTLTWSGRLDPSVNSLVPSPSPFGFVSMADVGVPPLECPENCDDGGWTLSGFNIGYQGKTYTDVIMSINGVVELGAKSGDPVTAANERLPSNNLQNNLLAPFWTDMNLGDGGHAYAAVLDDGTNLYDVFSWESVPRFDDPTTYTYQIWTVEGTEDIWFVYAEVPAIPADNLTVGFENSTGKLGTSYYYNGSGTPPTVGGDLKVTAAIGGTAELGFQAVLAGANGDTVLNIAQATSSSGTASALASTQIADLPLSLEVPNLDGLAGRCKNIETGEIWAGALMGLNGVACEVNGLQFASGDTLAITAVGRAMSSTSIFAQTYGMEVHVVRCQNQTTDQRVDIQLAGQGSSWDCVESGLVVNLGDIISMTVAGNAL
jgi:uncharacterized repeat protein (TIGR01451 family)